MYPRHERDPAANLASGYQVAYLKLPIEHAPAAWRNVPGYLHRQLQCEQQRVVPTPCRV